MANRIEAKITGDIHEPDFNGTHGPIGGLPTTATLETIARWRKKGNIFALNTSDNKHQASRFGDLQNGAFIGELGGVAYGLDGEKLAVFNPLSEAELTTVADSMLRAREALKSAVFLPRFDKADNHGVQIFVDPSMGQSVLEKLKEKYRVVDHIARDPDDFARLMHRHKGDICMVTFQFKDGMRAELLNSLNDLQISEDTSGSVFVTKQGVNKATTFLEVLDTIYKRAPDETVSFAGDSEGTDGVVFEVPGIKKIAVGDPHLVNPDVPGEFHYVKNPEGARKVLEMWMMNK